MFTQAQLEYIQKQFARGLNKDAIRNKLIDAGWELDDIEDGFREYERTAPKTDAQIISDLNQKDTTVKPEEIPQVAASTSLGTTPVNIDNNPILQPQVQPQVEVTKTMPNIEATPSKSSGGKIFLIIFAIIIVLSAGLYVFYKFIYLPKVGSVSPISSSTVVTLPESSDAMVSTTSEQIPELPKVEGMGDGDASTSSSENTQVDNSVTDTTPIENFDNSTPPPEM